MRDGREELRAPLARGGFIRARLICTRARGILDCPACFVP
jgi:hypothetical protein